MCQQPGPYLRTSSAVGGYDGSADWGGCVADKESDDLGDRLRLNGSGQHLRWEHRLVLRGGDHLRDDHVDADAERPQLDVEGARQMYERGLRGGVGGRAGGWLDAWAGGDVHDGAESGLLHVRRNCLGQPQRGADVDVDHRLEGV